jgi:hypothetical protein
MLPRNRRAIGSERIAIPFDISFLAAWSFAPAVSGRKMFRQGLVMA